MNTSNSARIAGGSDTPLRAVIADDAALIRQGVAAVLGDAGITVVAEAADAPSLVTQVLATEPDLVITDIRMPPNDGADGLRAALAIRDRLPEVGILLLSNHAETRHLSTLLEHGSAGIGYLLKERVVEIDDFIDAITRVAEGGTVLDPEIVEALLGQQRHRQRLAVLTPRERQVLAMIATGASNAALSESLYVSAKTVETHVQRIFTKLSLYEDARDNRRVKAVLAFLEATDNG